jgi:hypothetical protein
MKKLGSRWTTKASEKYFTIFEGLETENDENPPIFTIVNLYIQIPKTKIESINHVRLFLKCREKTCQLYNLDEKIIQNLIQKLKRIELHKFQVFKKVIEILPEISVDSRKLSSSFQTFMKPLSLFLETIKFHEFKHISMYTAQTEPNKASVKLENSSILISSDDDFSKEDEDSEDLNEKETIESSKIRFFSKSSGRYFTFHKGTELENTQQEIKFENLFILVCKVIPIEKMNHLRIGVKHQGNFGIVHDITNFVGPLIQLLKIKEKDLNGKLFPIVISLLNCYSSPIFYKNSKRTGKIETTEDFKKEIGTQVSKRKSPVFLKRNIQKEIQKESSSESDSNEDSEEIFSENSSEESFNFNSSDVVSIWTKNSKKEFPVNKEELKKYFFHSWDSTILLDSNAAPVSLIYNENVLRLILKIINKETIPKLNLRNDELFQLFKFIQLNSTLDVSPALIYQLLNNLKHSLTESPLEYQLLMSRVYQHSPLEFAQALMIKLMSQLTKKEDNRKRKRKSTRFQKFKK